MGDKYSGATLFVMVSFFMLAPAAFGGNPAGDNNSRESCVNVEGVWTATDKSIMLPAEIQGKLADPVTVETKSVVHVIQDGCLIHGVMQDETVAGQPSQAVKSYTGVIAGDSLTMTAEGLIVMGQIKNDPDGKPSLTYTCSGTLVMPQPVSSGERTMGLSNVKMIVTCAGTAEKQDGATIDQPEPIPSNVRLVPFPPSNPVEVGRKVKIKGVRN